MKQKLPWMLAVMAIAIAAVVWFRDRAKLTRFEQRAESLRSFCFATKEAFRDDWRAFTSGDPTKREAAYARFYDGEAMHHNVTSFMMCASAEPPKVPLQCTVDKDWDCLGKLAKQMHELLP